MVDVMLVLTILTDKFDCGTTALILEGKVCKVLVLAVGRSERATCHPNATKHSDMRC